MSWIFTCWSCKESTEMQTKAFRTHTCPRCGSAVRACLNCRHYDRHASNECREPMADYVHDKERANFCDYFDGAEGQDGGQDEAAAARAKLEALFKK